MIKIISESKYNEYSAVYKPSNTEDARQAAKQVFDNASSRYLNKGGSMSDFRLDVELDTEKFWDTLTSLCKNKRLAYSIVFESENFDFGEICYTINLSRLQEGIEEFPDGVTVQIDKFSNISYSYIKVRTIPNVVRIEDTDNFFYITTSDGRCSEYAKDSLFDDSYRYTIEENL